MKYKVTVETLTPLHIGTGDDLLINFDYVSHGGRTFVINQDAVYADEYESRRGDALLNVPAAKLKSIDQFYEGSPYVLYTLESETSIERIQEQIKDIYKNCYLPGSSLKGALRTALLSYAQTSGILSKAQVHYVENRYRKGEYIKEKAADNFEAIAFRPMKDSANYDLLRALQVSDSVPLPIKPSPMILCSVRVFTEGEKGLPVEVEAIKDHVVFEAEITIDELTIKRARDPKFTREKLGWENNQSLLMNIIPILQRVGHQRIQEELRSATDKGFEETVKIYRKLDAFSKKLQGSPSAILQIGWGTGWSGMTIGPLLSKPVQDEARRKFKLGKPPGAGRNWEPDLTKPFPKSRRLKAMGEDIPHLPLGWVALTFEPIHRLVEE